MVGIVVTPESKMYDCITIFGLKVHKGLFDSTRLIAAIVGIQYGLIKELILEICSISLHAIFLLAKLTKNKINT